MNCTIIPPPTFPASGPWHPKMRDDMDPRKGRDVLLASSTDARMVVLVWREPQWTHTADFVMFSAVSFARDGRTEDPSSFWLPRLDAIHNGDPTPNVCDAEWTACGTLKWDGCVNFEWFNDPSCLSHKCSLREFDQIAQGWRMVYALAARLMPTDYDVDGVEVRLATRLAATCKPA